MLTKYLHAVLFFCVIITGCVSYQVEKFCTNEEISEKLVNLDVKPLYVTEELYIPSADTLAMYQSLVNQLAILRTPPEARAALAILGLAKLGYDLFSQEKIDSNQYKRAPYSVRDNDANNIIMHEFRNNILSPLQPSYGTIRVKIINVDTHNKWGYFIPSVMTLFACNLFSFPIGAQESSIILIVGIYDQKDNLISSYVTDGKGTAYSALFWGYSMAGVMAPPDKSDIAQAPRAAHSLAVKNALAEIKKKINADLGTINNKLKSAKSE